MLTRKEKRARRTRYTLIPHVEGDMYGSDHDDELVFDTSGVVQALFSVQPSLVDLELLRRRCLMFDTRCTLNLALSARE